MMMAIAALLILIQLMDGQGQSLVGSSPGEMLHRERDATRFQMTFVMSPLGAKAVE
jgi:hypothetical protein